MATGAENDTSKHEKKKKDTMETKMAIIVTCDESTVINKGDAATRDCPDHSVRSSEDCPHNVIFFFSFF